MCSLHRIFGHAPERVQIVVGYRHEGGRCKGEYKRFCVQSGGGEVAYARRAWILAPCRAWHPVAGGKDQRQKSQKGGLLRSVMQAGLLAGIKIVARQRHSVALVRKLKLKHGLLLFFKGHDAHRQIIAPHPDEPIVIKCAHLIGMGIKPGAPVAQGLGVMQAPDFDIAGPEAGLIFPAPPIPPPSPKP